VPHGKDDSARPRHFPPDTRAPPSRSAASWPGAVIPRPFGERSSDRTARYPPQHRAAVALGQARSSGTAVTGRADGWIRRTTIGMCGAAGADQFREYYRHLMIVLREHEDFGTHNRRR
jgi:hypothetical protein